MTLLILTFLWATKRLVYRDIYDLFCIASIYMFVVAVIVDPLLIFAILCHEPAQPTTNI